MKKNKCSRIVISTLIIIGILILFNDVYAACAKCGYTGEYMGQPCSSCDGKPAESSETPSSNDKGYTCPTCRNEGTIRGGSAEQDCPDCKSCSMCGGDGILPRTS